MLLRLMIRLRLKLEQLTEKEFNKIHCGLHAVSTKTERDWPDLCFTIVSGRLGNPWTSSYMVNSLRPRNLVPGAFFCLCVSAGTNRRQEPALMRINVWIVLIVLIALFAATRLLRYHQDTQRICADDPSASVCER